MSDKHKVADCKICGAAIHKSAGDENTWPELLFSCDCFKKQQELDGLVDGLVSAVGVSTKNTHEEVVVDLLKEILKELKSLNEKNATTTVLRS